MAHKRKSKGITAKKRKSIPKAKFGLPGSRRYPVDTRKRAALAKGFAKAQLKQGNLSPSSYRQIVAKANKRLAKKR
jgi:hypothetical protein